VPERFDQERHPGLRLAENGGRALAGEDLRAQRFALDRFAVGLRHRQGGGVKFGGHVQLRQCAVPLPHHGQQLEQENTVFCVGGVLADQVLQGAERSGKFAFTNEL